MSLTRIWWAGVLIACGGLSCLSPQAGTTATQFQGPINAAGRSSTSTILIVPTNEADKAIQRRIHEYADRIRALITDRYPDREVKVLTDREALDQDLSHSSVSVYGTLRGNLWLARYGARLPVVIEPNRITTDRVHEGCDLRFITSWPHPGNPRLGVVVYTAQRAEDVVGINGVFHGPTDYVVARGGTLLQSDNYISKTERWTFRGELSLPQAAEDLDYLFQTVERVHPNHLANLSQAQYRELKDRSRAALAGACEDDGRVSRAVVAVTAAQAAASFGDGHTSCRLGTDLLDPDDPSACMPPFRLRWQAGQVVIAGTIPGLEHLNDARLIEINNRPFGEAIAPILMRISGERQAFRTICFLGNQEAHWALARPVEGAEMTITVRRIAGRPQTLKVPLIPLARYRKELPPESRSDPATFREFHEDSRTYYWRYDSFVHSADAQRAIDAVFKDVREREARNLVIDLRFNGGGNSKAAEYIFNYLTSAPYRIYSRVDVKVSRPLLQREQLGMLGPLARLFQGRVVTSRLPRLRPRDVECRFEGSLYVIIGPGTFSTASDFAHVVKDYRLGTLIGEETGGLRRCFGDCPGFQMPNSGLRFSVSTKRWHAPIPRPDDATRGTVPDIPINDDDLAPFAHSPDPERAFALDLIAGRAGIAQK